MDQLLDEWEAKLGMSLAESQVAPREERRRSERSPLGLPLAVRGVSLDMRPFQEDTFTLSVSGNGALVALATTVTLGQTLFLKNPRSQDEAEAWVTRFGPPRGTRTQVGIEFVQPGADFWSDERQTEPPTGGTEQRAEQEAAVPVMQNPGENPAAESISSDSSKGVSRAETTSSYSEAAARPTLHDVLLNAVEQTLQQAAEQVVAAAMTPRLGAAVNQAAEAIENFSRGRIRQLEERLGLYREELVTSAHGEFLSRIKAGSAQTEEHLRNCAAELLEEAARKAHSDFADRLGETANRAVAQFDEDARSFTSQHFGNLTEQVQASIDEARSQFRLETDRAVTEAEQKVESLISQNREVYAEWETRLQATLDKARQDLLDQVSSVLESVRTQTESQENRLRETIAQLGDQAVQAHEMRLDQVSRSSQQETIDKLGRDSDELLETLVRSAEQRLHHTCNEVFVEVGEAFRQRLLALSFPPPAPKATTDAA